VSGAETVVLTIVDKLFDKALGLSANKVIEKWKLTERFGVDKTHELTKNILRSAIYNTAQGCILEQSVADRLLETNYEVVFEWLLAEASAPIDWTKVNITLFTGEIGDEEQVSTFLEALREEIELQKKTQYPPYAQTTIRQNAEILQAVSELQKKLPEYLESFRHEQLQNSDLTSQVSRFTSSQPFQSIQNTVIDSDAELSLIKAELKEGHIATARQKALNLVEHLKSEQSPDRKRLSATYELLANTYIFSEQDQASLLEYLKDAEFYCEDDNSRILLRAQIHYLRQEYQTALELIEKLIDLPEFQVNATYLTLSIHYATNETKAILKLIDRFKDADDPALHTAFAWYANLVGEHELALHHANSAIALDPTKNDPKVYKADAIAFLYDKAATEFGKISGETVPNLREALELASTAIAGYSPEFTYKLANAYARRGTIHNLLFEHEEAIADFRKSLEYAPDNPQVRQNFLVSLSANEKFDELLSELNKVREIGNDFTLIRLKIHALLAKDEPKRALHELDSLIGSESSSDDLKRKLKILKIEALDRDFQTTKAEALIDELSVVDLELQMARINHLKRIGKQEQLLPLYEELDRTILDKRRFWFVEEYAAWLFNDGKPESLKKAKELLDPIVTGDLLTKSNDLFAEILYRLGAREELLAFCNKVESRFGFQPRLTELQAILYYNANDLTAALPHFEKLAKAHLTSAFHQFNYARCLFRMGRTEEGKDVLMQAERSIKDSLRDLIEASQIFSLIGNYEKAIYYATKAYQQFTDNADTHLNFIGVTLKAVNEQFVPKPEIEDLHRKILSEFPTRFPNDNRLQAIPLANEPEKLIVQMKEMLMERHKHIEAVETEYLQHRLSVRFLSKGAGHNLLETMRYISVKETLKFWAESGDLIRLQEEIESASNCNRLVIGDTALLTLELLELLVPTLDSFEKVFVAQTFVDELNSMIAGMQLYSNAESFTMGLVGEQIVKQDNNKESTRAEIEYIHKLVKTLTEHPNVELVGSKPLPITKTEETAQFDSEFTNEIGFLPFAIGKKFGVKVLDLEFQLREFCKISFGIESFGIRAILETLRTRDVIDYEQLQNKLLRLIRHHYFFVSVNKDTLLQALQNSDYRYEGDAIAVFEFLRDPNFSFEGLISVASEFLIELWNRQLSLETKQKWTDHLLFVVTHQRPKYLIVKQILERIHQRGQLLPATLQQLGQTVDLWFRVQTVI